MGVEHRGASGGGEGKKYREGREGKGRGEDGARDFKGWRVRRGVRPDLRGKHRVSLKKRNEKTNLAIAPTGFIRTG